MRRIAILLVLTALAGCKGVTGPFDSRRPRDRPDDPLFTIEEQKRRGAERLSIPEDNPRVTPDAYISRPSPTGLTNPDR
jgi:hypothetical protein